MDNERLLADEEINNIPDICFNDEFCPLEKDIPCELCGKLQVSKYQDSHTTAYIFRRLEELLFDSHPCNYNWTEGGYKIIKTKEYEALKAECGLEKIDTD